MRQIEAIYCRSIVAYDTQGSSLSPPEPRVPLRHCSSKRRSRTRRQPTRLSSDHQANALSGPAMKGWVRWLRPPAFADEAKAHEAFLLHVVVWTMVLVPPPYVLLTSLRTPQASGRALAQGLCGEVI